MRPEINQAAVRHAGMEQVKPGRVFACVAGGVLGFAMPLLGYHYIVGQSWEFLLGDVAGVIVIGLIMLAVRYMRRWFEPYG